MPTQPYYTKDGTRVPGVTTILGARKAAGGLMHWAWNLGMQGKDYRKVRDEAADAGTLAHLMIEKWLAKEDPLDALATVEDLEVQGLAQQGFGAFLDWSRQTKIEVLDQEMGLVSELFGFGGTPDAVAHLDGKLVLLDWKTSNAVYTDHIMQIAAYQRLWEENNPKDPLEGHHLLRFGKEFGDFHHHSYPQTIMDTAWSCFVNLQCVYNAEKTLRKVTR